MKNKVFKAIGLVAGAVLSLSALAACGPVPAEAEKLHYDDSVVKAFRAVTPEDGLVSQTATADGEDYIVTIVTSSSVAEYHLDASFRVDYTVDVFGGIFAPVALEETVPLSDLEQAYAKALELSGIDKAAVIGFDFDRDTYMGEAVIKVEIEDDSAEYSYTFDAADFTLIASKTELKHTNQASGTSYIGEDKAKAIALGAAAVEEGATANYTVKLIADHGTKVYRVGFDSDGFRYTVDVNAVSGAIVKFAMSILDENAVLPDIPAEITEEDAKRIALEFAFPDGYEGVEILFRKVKLDYEDGMFIYEVEFLADGSEYEFEISVASGTILDVEIDTDHRGNPPAGGKFLTQDEAVAKVLEVVGSDAFVVEVDIEKSHGNVYYYEIEVLVDGKEAEYFVDAVTGTVSRNDDYAGNPATGMTPTLTEEDALRIALDSFELTAEQITYQKVKLEREHSRLVYEIKLFVGGSEYEISVDAHSGEIVEREIDHDHDGEFPSHPAESGYITREEARAAVIAYFAAQGKSARIREVEWEDKGSGANKQYFYEVEVQIDGREYECYVDAVTGEVRVKGELVEGGELIGEKRALSIALDHFSVSEREARVIKVKLEEDDGILLYEVEFKVRDLEYTVEIDAMTGNILEFDVSFD